MTTKTHLPAKAPRRALMAALCAIGALSPGHAGAAEPPYTSTAGTYAGSGSVESGTQRRLDLSIGRSVVIDLPRDAKEVFVANPAVANAVVRSTRKIFLIGMANGATSVFVMDAEGRQIALLEVNVGRDLNVLRQTLRTAIPNGRIEVKPAGDSILLTGQVASASDAQQAVDIAKAFVGQTSAAPTGGGSGVAISLGASSTVSGNVINALTINGKDQVMLRVTVVEVARSVLKQLGVSISGTWSAIDIATSAYFPVATQSIAGLGTLTGANRSGNTNFGATLQAFDRAGVSRVLAEPTLVAISGESATFTAGGEVPVPTSQDCTNVGGVQSCQIGTSFKPYGVNLAFTPLVLSENRIALRVNTEVTEVDPENQLKIGSINVPGFRVRKTSTSVELPSGASMVTAGLLSQTSSSAVSGLPGLMNLPVLGTLFRSRDYQRRDTELMIMVTPFIAKPMEAGQAARPDDGFVDARDTQTILFGRLNKLYGVTGPAAAPGWSGRFGYITD